MITSNLLKLTVAAFTALSVAAGAQDLRNASLVSANGNITAFNESSATTTMMHIIVGRSIFINTGERVSRVFVANPAVLDSYTVDPHQVVITAKATGVSSLILWDEGGRSQSYQISSDLDVDDLTAAVHNAYPMDDVHVHGSESRAVLTGNVGTQAESDAIAKLAGIYTKDVSDALVVDSTRVKQVRLKVRIVEHHRPVSVYRYAGHTDRRPRRRRRRLVGLPAAHGLRSAELPLLQHEVQHRRHRTGSREQEHPSDPRRAQHHHAQRREGQLPRRRRVPVPRRPGRHRQRNRDHDPVPCVWREARVSPHRER
jgi:hypothetical protein